MLSFIDGLEDHNDIAEIDDIDIILLLQKKFDFVKTLLFFFFLFSTASSTGSYLMSNVWASIRS